MRSPAREWREGPNIWDGGSSRRHRESPPGEEGDTEMHPGSQGKRKLPEGEAQGWHLPERGQVCRERHRPGGVGLWWPRGKRVTMIVWKPTMAPWPKEVEAMCATCSTEIQLRKEKTR